MKLHMQPFRGRASVVASFALTWHILALMFVPAVLCGQQGQGLAGQSEIANCPMHHAAGETCPMHETATQGQGGSYVGCSQADSSFLALFSTIAVLPSLIETPVPDKVESAAVPASPSSNSLAPAPISPPPRV